MGYDFTPESTARYLGSLGYLAVVGSVIGFGAYFLLVGRIGASQGVCHAVVHAGGAIAFDDIRRV